jgi:glycosyltransferase involved in cell wall biosynthesis
MKFLIISHVFHYQNNNNLLAYTPYVREMNLWIKHVNQVKIIAPILTDFDDNINFAYQHQHISIEEVYAFSLIGFREKIETFTKLPSILKSIYTNMRNAEHIHLRCPGNMGLLGCIVQILFPKKPKTAKYAGNWDPKAKQPWSYKLQKWILSNTYLSKNIQILVYGEWPNQSKNIKPFFTASYFNHEKEPLYSRNYKGLLKFCFIGSLSEGKQPALALQIVMRLREIGIQAELHIYGNGILLNSLQAKVKKQKAEDWVKFYRNQPKEVIKKVLQFSHFLILPSKSEGWPKVVSEAMFWGCIPIVTPVSCVPWMLEYGKRGVLMNDQNLNLVTKKLESLLTTPEKLEIMANNASLWSREYTLDKFENEIKNLLMDGVV